MVTRRIAAVLLCLLLSQSHTSAQWWRWFRPSPPRSTTYWVSPTGTATWQACNKATALDGTAACSFATALANAAAGHRIYLRGGTYNTPLRPVRSGTLASRVTWSGYVAETARITEVGNQPGVFFDGISYHRVLNLLVEEVNQLGYITNGSSFNEFAYITFRNGTGPANSGFNILSVSSDSATANTDNWVHHNEFSGGGKVEPAPVGSNGCGDSGGLFNVGADGVLDGFSDRTTIEDNVFQWGAHHALKVNTRSNVVRRNFIHNEEHFTATTACQLAGVPSGKFCAPAGLYGNRALTVLNNHTTVPSWFSNTRNLIARNRIGPGGLPSDGNGADGLTLGGEWDIARFNAVYGARENGILFRVSGNIAKNLRVYHNTVFANGNGPACRLPPINPGFVISGMRLTAGADNNVIVNNLLRDNPSGSGEIRNSGTGNTISNNWLQANGDPLFVDASLEDYTSPTLPDLSLQAGSGAIDSAVPLTQANGPGAATTVLVLDDATVFQYGERGSELVRLNGTMHADEIAIGTVGNTVKIVSIDYATNTVTLEQARTWDDDAPVWLFRDDSGQQVLHGLAPDKGAYERQP